MISLIVDRRGDVKKKIVVFIHKFYEWIVWQYYLKVKKERKKSEEKKREKCKEIFSVNPHDVCYEYN